MSSSLFGLISLAGSASLGELRARGSTDAVTMAHEIVEMLRRGAVQLSENADFSPSLDAKAVLNGVIQEANQIKNGTGSTTQESQISSLVAKLESVMNNEETAQSIIVDPTSRGFRLSF